MAVHLLPSDLHGLSRLAVDGVGGTVALVEQMHHTIARGSAPVGQSGSGRTRGITGLVYRSISGVTGVVGGTMGFAFEKIVPWLGSLETTPERDRWVSALNGVLGDYLADTDNPLALPMQLRHEGRAIDMAAGDFSALSGRPTGKLVIFIHGLCLSDACWTTPGSTASLPASLAGRLDATSLTVYYNSGRHVSENGLELSRFLEELMIAWPEPIEEIVLIGHSMGGLVARSACHYAAGQGHHWPNRVRRLITLGSPHHGAPLERIGNKVDRLLTVSPYSAPFTRLGKIRSAGITDLRHGNVVEDDWRGRDLVVSGTRSGSARAHPGRARFRCRRSGRGTSRPTSSRR
jgi:pimeloyl-ACP methyl ester carboxylesterase